MAFCISINRVLSYPAAKTKGKGWPDRCIVEYPIKIKLIARDSPAFNPGVLFCFSCVRRRGGCGVPSARHGVLRYVRIIQHAYTVIQLNYQIPRTKYREKEIKRSLFGVFRYLDE